MALGAPPIHVARRVTMQAFAMVLAGAVAGLLLRRAAERYVEALVYGVRATDLALLVRPSLTLCAAAVLAALPPVIRAVRTDPAQTLRAE